MNSEEASLSIGSKSIVPNNRLDRSENGSEIGHNQYALAPAGRAIYLESSAEGNSKEGLLLKFPHIYLADAQMQHLCRLFITRKLLHVCGDMNGGSNKMFKINNGDRSGTVNVLHQRSTLLFEFPFDVDVMHDGFFDTDNIYLKFTCAAL